MQLRLWHVHLITIKGVVFNTIFNYGIDDAHLFPGLLLRLVGSLHRLKQVKLLIILTDAIKVRFLLHINYF